MSMLNSQPRFAVDEADGRVFSYLTGRYYPPVGTITEADGTWDAAKIKAAILSGQSVHGALTVSAVDKVTQANAEFEAGIAAAMAATAEELKQAGIDPATANTTVVTGS
jgi:hypothetical protein